MSGGGAGPIIIKRFARTAAESSSVRDNLSSTKLQRLDEILAKADADWTNDEFHFVMRAIGEAHDNAS